MTQHPEIFAALAAPFEPQEVKTRSGGQGRQLSYITATTVANRLDDVLGPECWEFELSPWGEDALIGTLIVRLPDGATLRKSNVGGKADMQAADDDCKSAASDCLKRCAALLGVGRYLYRDGVPKFAQGLEVKTSLPPSLPTPATNGHRKERHVWGGGPRPAAQAPGNHGPARAGGQPRTGRAFYAQLREKDRDCPGIFKHLVEWGSAQGFPAKLTEWSFDMVKAAEGEVAAALAYASQAS